jgi:hypothetical protein
MVNRRIAAGLISGALALTAAASASAFCGFYVGGADAKLVNNATQVVLMRDGVRTVLSMANNYQGPPERFAMVVPVPVVLHEENVKTLPREVFERVDQIASPRLVEYWEQDPCPPPVTKHRRAGGPSSLMDLSLGGQGVRNEDDAVRIEAQFTVGEYEIVILSATDSMALDRWIRAAGYSIPAGAEPYLRPYVQQGMKFFVAKVDVTKVRFESGQAMLSPLRFHYDSEQFHLPIRLGLINSSGSQDLIVNILARNQRYEVANYENIAVPTNIDVSEATRSQFGAFYTRVFEDTLRRHPRAVVTEYAWQATTCDPCPTQPLNQNELSVLGADVAPSLAPPEESGPPFTAPGGGPISPRKRPWRGGGSDFVLTRLHARYTRDALGDDLFFRAAAPIVGGREHLVSDGKLEQGALPAGSNNFQARYAIRHPWTGPISCLHPQRGIWGGPPGEGRGGVRTQPAPRLGLQKAGDVPFAALLKGAMPPETFLTVAGATPALVVPPPAAPTEAGGVVDAGAPDAAAPPGPSGPPPEPPGGGCAGCAVGGDGAGASGAGLAAVLASMLRRRRRRA